MEINILVIEDSASQALRLQLLLKRAGYDVRIAHDGAEGWLKACSLHPELILLDINLPRMNGFCVLALLKRNKTTDTIPVVMLTSHDRLVDVEEAVALGADGYLFKDDCLFRSEGAQQIVDTINQLVAFHPRDMI